MVSRAVHCLREFVETLQNPYATRHFSNGLPPAAGHHSLQASHPEKRDIMENPARSKLTRDAAIKAAVEIIERDGLGKLTIDAIARESGISKGGVLHHFKTKDAVLNGIFQRQIDTSRSSFKEYFDDLPSDTKEPTLKTQIEILRRAIMHQKSTIFALAGALSASEEILSTILDQERNNIEIIKAEAPDANIALVRWAAAQGLALSSILGMCPLSEQERDRLFERLSSDEYWTNTDWGEKGSA